MTYQPGADQGRPEQWRGPSEIGDVGRPVPPPLPDPGTAGQGMPEIVPDHGAAPYRGAPPPARPEKSDPLIAVLGDIVRTGRWRAARKTNALQLMGDLKLDLRAVLVPGETLEIESWSLMGDIRIVVPPGTDVVITGGAMLGDVRTESDQRAQPAPRTGARLVVRGYTLMGDVIVREMGDVPGKPPRGWRWVTPRR